MREEWSTDVAFIYIKTPNAEDPDIFGSDYNITSQSILHEISWIEGDDEGRAPGLTQNGLDWDKEDLGKNDGVLDHLNCSGNQRNQLKQCKVQ